VKANFKISKTDKEEKISSENNEKSTKNLSRSEFEDFIIKSGAKGSFMVYRSTKKEDELGLEEL
jgi:hypothetical protein